MARLAGGSDGFTIVEVVVTLVIIGIFSIVILNMQAQVSTISIFEVQHTRASYLAYDNMRAYVNDSPPSWFKCNASASTGYKVMTKSGHVDGLPGVVKQEVVVSAPYAVRILRVCQLK